MNTFILVILLIFSPSILAFDKVKGLTLRGQGEYKWFFMSIYEAKLWGSHNEDFFRGSILLELKYRRSFKGKDIAKQSEKELLRAGVDIVVLNKWRPKMLDVFPNVQAGDSIQASYDPLKGITFYYNNSKELGKFDDVEFSQSFLNIWLGEKTSDPELRNKLLGKNI